MRNPSFSKRKRTVETILFLWCICLVSALTHASIIGPVKHGNCLFDYNSTFYMYAQYPSAAQASLYALAFPFSTKEGVLPWKDLHGANEFTPEGCGVTSDGRVILVGSDLSIWQYNIDQPAWTHVPVQAPLRPKNGILTAISRNIFVVYDTSSRESYLLDVHNPPPWNWAIINPTNSTPPSTERMIAAGSYIYHMYNNQSNGTSANHLYAFDPVSKQWIGYVGSFLGPNNLSVTSHADKIFVFSTTDSMPLQPKELSNLFWTLAIQNTSATIQNLFVKQAGTTVQLPSAMTTATFVNDQTIVFYDSPKQGNETYLTWYDPETNTQRARYIISRLSPLPFWETEEGQHTRIGLICALTIPLGLLAIFTIHILRRSRKVRARTTEKLPFEDGNQGSKEMKLLDEKSVEDAETWSRRVLRILFSINHPPKNASRASSCSDLLAPKKKFSTALSSYVPSPLKEVSTSSSSVLQQEQYPRAPAAVKTKEDSSGQIRHALQLGNNNTK
ncbi:hypothetical protein EC973_001584 [Apophysomyces ossiformis]|uniref:Uncharacterized protein n=1 Tax=Apophysomyces ossiformis TaxID=679940 RepID=A0A8H7BPW6_9FUNG|nr:hypothetical protein EC973_001584 [Apophysomyces ossiformis]